MELKKSSFLLPNGGTAKSTERRSRNQARTTGTLPVSEYGLEGRGTKFMRHRKILANDSAGVSASVRRRIPRKGAKSLSSDQHRRMSVQSAFPPIQWEVLARSHFLAKI